MSHLGLMNVLFTDRNFRPNIESSGTGPKVVRLRTERFQISDFNCILLKAFVSLIDIGPRMPIAL